MKSLRLPLLLFIVVAISHYTFAGDWTIVPSPSQGKQANGLLGVASAGENDVWAVGLAFSEPLFAYRTLIEHWDGTRWAIVRTPNATDGYNILNGVAVVAADDIWSVGQAAAGNNNATLIEHWNGRTWKIVPSPNVAGHSNILEAVTVISASDIWAVGYSVDSNFNTTPLTLHWNGATWIIITSPAVQNAILFAASGVTSQDVWAVGRGQNEQSLTLHWDGSIWSVIPSPNDSTEDNNLFGVAALATNDVWAVGTAGSLKTLAIHWDGVSWSIVPTPGFSDPINNEVMVGIVALAPDNIFTAGQYLQSSIQQTLPENWNGVSWSVIASPNVRNSNNRLHAITVTPAGTLWSVGTTGVFGKAERTFVLRKDP